jgi:putative oxidoreductase
MNGSLLALRLVAGFAFILHGWSKTKNPLGWMGPGTPAVLQALAVVAELGGGLGWMLGLLTPVASAGIACTMIAAICRHAFVKGDPFLGGYELAAIYLCIAILLATVGPGRFAIDRWLFPKLEPTKSCLLKTVTGVSNKD